MEPGLQHSQSPYRALLLGQSYLQQGKTDKAIATLSAVVGSPHAVPCAHADESLERSKTPLRLSRLSGSSYLRQASNPLNVVIGAHILQQQRNSVQTVDDNVDLTVVE
jgi:hypothetical protein